MLSSSLLAFLAAATSAVLSTTAAVQVIGPVTDLHIVNAPISPDGFTRQAVLAEGIYPGPIITANKVRRLTHVPFTHLQ